MRRLGGPRAPLLMLLLTLVSAWLAIGCCNIPIDLDLEDLNEPPDDDDAGGISRGKTRAGRVDLGTASFPGGNDAKRVKLPWWLKKLKPSKYELGYKLTKSAGKTIHSDYMDFSKSVGHRRIDKDRFQWRPSRRCQGGLHCVYEALDKGSAKGVEPIARLFRKRASKAGLNSLELASLVLTFVQEIKYKIPDNEPFGVMPPALVVKNRWGDCDSKTLLAHMILRSLGVRSVLISSNAHKHTMLGVALPAPGRSFTYQGSKYAFVELTAKRSPIGQINPRLLRPNDWRVVSMRYKPVGELPEPGAGDDDDDDAPTKKKKKRKKKKKKKKGKKKRGGAAGILGGGKIKIR